MPFIDGLDFKIILDQYVGTISQYNYQTLNAYNLYGFLGNNFKDVNDILFLEISAKTFGFLTVIFFSSFTILYLYKNRHNKHSLFLASSFINLTTFLFCIKMHERYLFPSLLFLLITYIITCNKKYLILYLLFSFTYYVNCFDVLKLSLYNYDYSLLDYGIKVISFINLILFCYFFYLLIMSLFYYQKDYICEKTEQFYIKIYKPIKEDSFKIVKKDFIIITILTTIYFFMGVYNLGDIDNPKTFAKFDRGSKITVTFNEPEYVKSVSILNGVRNDRTIILRSDQLDDVYKFNEVELLDVFKWYSKPIEKTTDSFEIIINEDDTYLHEVVFLDQNLEPIEIKEVTSNVDDKIVSNIFDEQNLVETKYSYKNSTYFDEIYHARTAFELARSGVGASEGKIR